MALPDTDGGPDLSELEQQRQQSEQQLLLIQEETKLLEEARQQLLQEHPRLLEEEEQQQQQQQQKQQQQQLVVDPASILCLDANSLVRVFSFLPLASLAASQLVCRRWKAVIRGSALLWQLQLADLLRSTPDFDCRGLSHLLDFWKENEARVEYDLDGGEGAEEEEEEGGKDGKKENKKEEKAKEIHAVPPPASAAAPPPAAAGGLAALAAALAEVPAAGAPGPAPLEAALADPASHKYFMETDVDGGSWYGAVGGTCNSRLTGPILKATNHQQLGQYRDSMRKLLLDATATEPRLLRQLVMTMRQMICNSLRLRPDRSDRSGDRTLASHSTAKRFPRDDFILHAVVDEQSRVLAFSPLSSTKVVILDMDYLKHVSTINLPDDEPVTNFRGFRHFLSFNGDFLYVCLNGSIGVWRWKEARKVGEVAPTLDVRWMVFPVYTTRGGASFLGALDHQLIYVFNVTGAAAAAPVIKQVLLAAEPDYPAIEYPWTNMHMTDQMVIGYRNLIGENDNRVPGHSFHFWSVYTGILLRRYFFNYADFDRVDPVQFVTNSTVKFVGSRAFLTLSGVAAYIFPLKLVGVVTAVPTLQPKWTPWAEGEDDNADDVDEYRSPDDIFGGSHGSIAFIHKRNRYSEDERTVFFAVYDFTDGEKLVCQLRKSVSTVGEILFFNGSKMIFLQTDALLRGKQFRVCDFLNEIPWDSYRFCFRCKKIGHEAKKCVEENLVCYLCRLEGHKAAECPAKTENSVCFRCREKGHLARDCVADADEIKKRKAPYVVVKTCRKCGGRGHVAGECRSTTHRRRCFKCAGWGHNAADCPNKKYYATNGRAVSCFVCRRKGHVRRDCPENKRNQREAAELQSIIDHFAALPKMDWSMV